MKVLFIGDVVGSLGVEMVQHTLPQLKKTYRPQLTIANGENAAQGRGITQKSYKQLLQSGVDVVTLGNHSWDHAAIYQWIEQEAKLLRPANFPKGAPGQGYCMIQVNDLKVAVINLQGRVFLNPLDDPFAIGQTLIERCRQETPLIFVDFHAEATSEKQAFGWYVDGQVSAVVGTHTHVQTNDARILPQGTAYLSDVGMTGAYDSVLGIKKEVIIEKFVTQLPRRHEVCEEGRRLLSACVIELDNQSGRAKKIETIQGN